MNYRKLMLFFAVLTSLFLTGCASGYKQFYKPVPAEALGRINERRVSPPPETPIIERSQPAAPDKILGAYAKRGYSMIGSATFNSGSVQSESSAVRQGQEVGADLVLILNPQYTGSVTSNVPITTPTSSTSYSTGTATATGPGGTVNAYGSGTTTTYGSQTTYIPVTVHRSDYGAVFFVKQRFKLGLFDRDLNDAERQELQSNKGSVVLQVVDGSPAFDADILVGDIITKIDGITVSNSRNFHELLDQRQGKRVTFTIVRKQQNIEKSVQLNP